jgi:hypothetical protein
MSKIVLTEEGAKPSTPAAGKWDFYFKADGLYYLDDAGTEVGPVTAGTLLSKAAGSDVATGTDDAKYVTSKSIKDSVNVPNVSPVGGTGNVLTSNGTAWTSAAAGGSSKFACDGRLTLETGVAISTTDQVDKTTLYFTPYQGNQIGLYDGVSVWTTISFAELSLNISAFTASKPYDIWVYNNAGTATLDSTVWTSGTVRATALALQDGVYVKTGATTRRYVGTIYMDAASKCQLTFGMTPAAGGSAPKCYVYNYYNRIRMNFMSLDSTGYWSYSTAVWRAKNAAVGSGIGNSFIFINGKTLEVSARGYGTAYSSTLSAFCAVGLGINKTNGYNGVSGLIVISVANYEVSNTSSVGFNATEGLGYIQEVEYGGTNMTLEGDADTAYIQTGAHYEMEI